MKVMHDISPAPAKIVTLLSALPLLTIVGCGGPMDHDDKTDLISSKPLSAMAATTEIGTISLDNGNTVSFYEVNGAAMISERGEAPTPPSVKTRQNRSRVELVSVWTELAPT